MSVRAADLRKNSAQQQCRQINKLSKDKDASHMLPLQPVAAAMNYHGYKDVDRMKDLINGQENLIGLPASQNRSQGQCEKKFAANVTNNVPHDTSNPIHKSVYDLGVKGAKAIIDNPRNNIGVRTRKVLEHARDGCTY